MTTPDPFAVLLRAHPAIAYDYLEFRRLVAGSAAGLAALRADPDHLRRLGEALAELEAAGADAAREARADAAFHLAIYEAAGNPLMTHVMRRVIAMMADGVFYDAGALAWRPGVREGFMRQHRALYQAIVAGDADAARRAAEAHLAAAEEALREAQRADARREVALRRRSGAEVVAHPSGRP
jgi:GntR family transcriptional repressor for pyruvate dehydrogenase complex